MPAFAQVTRNTPTPESSGVERHERARAHAEVGQGPTAEVSAQLGAHRPHDFSRIPVHASASQASEVAELSARIVASAGNRMVRLPLRGMAHPGAVEMSRPGVRFRLPEFNRVKAAMTDKDLKIPESVIKERVAQLLGRMKIEKRLKTKDPIAEIMKRIFPAPGKIDEAEFNKVIDPKDRTMIYKSVTDADRTVKKADKAGLKTAMADAAKLIRKVESDAAGLKAVFGTEDARAKANYVKARTALGTVSKHMDASVSTDYNLDDPEVGLGGWADFGAQHMHLLVEVVKVADPNETIVTLIHEASHLADPAVDDHGYYATPGFEAMTDVQKAENAAHYEELPRRELGTTSFPGATFKPGVKKGGKKMTREDDVRREASEYLRKAWDAAVDTHTFIRDVRKQYEAGSKKRFKDNEALIMEISRLMDLTIHEQAAGEEIVTTLDVTITESIARGTSIVKGQLSKVPFPSKKKAAKMKDDEIRDELVAAAVARYGHLLKDAKRDKKLLDWFVAHYRSLP